MYKEITMPVPSARESGKLRLGFLTSPAVNVTLFQASAENKDPTCATASTVNVLTSTPPPMSCKLPKLELRQKFPLKLAANAVAFRPTNKATATNPNNAAAFEMVNTF